VKKKTTKPKFRIRNWSQYNNALANRGSITFWFDDDAIRSWISFSRPGKRGKPRTYGEACILCMLLLKKEGRKKWKKQIGYHRRSLVETAFFRLKTIFSDKLRSRREDRQATEMGVRCGALNRMTELGMPDSYVI